MYRPTVRYDDLYQDYVTNLYNCTDLDRNQIIRAALFIAGHTEQFREIINPYLKRGMSFPEPLWSEDHHELWKQKAIISKPRPKKPKLESQQNQKTRGLNRKREGSAAGPKIFAGNQSNISLSLGGRQYTPR